MAETLRIDKKEMMEMFKNGLQTTRMTYYPPCPKPEVVMGLTPHSDATGITILLQVNGVEGLQVKKDGIWFPVSILPHALVVNVGDVLEVRAMLISDLINCLIPKKRNLSSYSICVCVS